MAVFFIFFVTLSILIVGLFLYIGNGDISLGGADFVARGKEAGLSIKEIKMLKKTADVLHMDRPLTLLGSVRNIDDAILQINDLLVQKDYGDMEIIDLLEDLHNYRKYIELERIEKRTSIDSSKEISINQSVKITIGSVEPPVMGHIVENTKTHLTVKIDGETTIKPGLNWNGPVNIFFWRKNDAGYYFESNVVEIPGPGKWNLSHSNELIRSQKRTDLRVDVDINAYVYKLENITKRNYKSQGFSGTFAQLKNISEGGAAFLINGKIQEGISLKIEFLIDEKVIVLCGIIKDSSYNQSNNVSYARMKIVEPPFEMLSVLRPFIFIKSREYVVPASDNERITVENVEKINNNSGMEDIDSDNDEVVDVEYLPENSEVHN